MNQATAAKATIMPTADAVLSLQAGVDPAKKDEFLRERHALMAGYAQPQQQPQVQHHPQVQQQQQQQRGLPLMQQQQQQQQQQQP